MPKKRFSAEQIVTLLRQIAAVLEVEPAELLKMPLKKSARDKHR